MKTDKIINEPSGKAFILEGLTFIKLRAKIPGNFATKFNTQTYNTKKTGKVASNTFGSRCEEFLEIT